MTLDRNGHLASTPLDISRRIIAAPGFSNRTIEKRSQENAPAKVSQGQ
jgi:hypothetical protein